MGSCTSAHTRIFARKGILATWSASCPERKIKDRDRMERKIGRGERGWGENRKNREKKNGDGEQKGKYRKEEQGWGVKGKRKTGDGEHKTKNTETDIKNEGDGEHEGKGDRAEAR